MRVHANSTVVLLMPGGPQAVAKGQDIDVDDPRVVAYPWLFEAPADDTDEDTGDEKVDDPAADQSEVKAEKKGRKARARKPGAANTKPGETR